MEDYDWIEYGDQIQNWADQFYDYLVELELSLAED